VSKNDQERGNGFGIGTLGRLLTAEEVAEMLQVPRSWVYERTRRRGLERLPHIKLGKYVRFEEGAVQEYLERLKAGN
jgi:excisionase family DNA binding protein